MCQDSIFKKGVQSPIKIAELRVSTAILNVNWQYYKGSTILVFQDHEKELHHLDSATQHKFMDDAFHMATALEKTYSEMKINHALLGNASPHLHWHLIVRRSTDPCPELSIWESEMPTFDCSEKALSEITEEIRQNL